MRDYLHDADDYAHLAADLPPRCGGCAYFEPRYKMGWAAHGRIYKPKEREGECTKYRIIVKEDGWMDEGDCFEEAV